MKAWTYTVTTAPTCPPISLAEVKSFARVSGSADDAVFNLIIAAVTEYAEKYTKRDFITRSYTTYRDEFDEVGELRRSKLIAITSIEYLVSASFSTVSTDVYYNTLETDFSEIALEEDQAWPTDGDTKLQAVKIIFTAGYGPDDRSVPSDLKLALMQHAVNSYENRGDCSVADAVPSQAQAVYDKYRILDIKVGL